MVELILVLPLIDLTCGIKSRADLTKGHDGSFLIKFCGCIIALQELLSMSFDFWQVTVPSITMLHTSVP
mgnify:CR=1 FL=1